MIAVHYHEFQKNILKDCEVPILVNGQDTFAIVKLEPIDLLVIIEKSKEAFYAKKTSDDKTFLAIDNVFSLIRKNSIIEGMPVKK